MGCASFATYFATPASREELRIVAGGEQPRIVGAGEFLVLPLERWRHLDLLNRGTGKLAPHRFAEIAEGARDARAAIVDARPRPAQEIQIDGDDIVDMDEITPEAFAAGEQLQGLAAGVLAHHLEDHRGHVALMILARAIDVEIAKAGDGAFGLGEQRADMLVEGELGEAIDIEGLLMRLGFREGRAAMAIDRRRRGIDEGNLGAEALMQQVARIGIVHPHHIPAVLLGGHGAGALVEYRIDPAEGREAGRQLVLVHIVGEARAAQIEVLAGVGEIIDDQYVVVASVIQRMDQIAADEAGPAGDDDHEVPRLSLLMTSVEE